VEVLRSVVDLAREGSKLDIRPEVHDPRLPRTAARAERELLVIAMITMHGHAPLVQIVRAGRAIGGLADLLHRRHQKRDQDGDDGDDDEQFDQREAAPCAKLPYEHGTPPGRKAEGKIKVVLMWD